MRIVCSYARNPGAAAHDIAAIAVVRNAGYGCYNFPLCATG